MTRMPLEEMQSAQLEALRTRSRARGSCARLAISVTSPFRLSVQKLRGATLQAQTLMRCSAGAGRPPSFYELAGDAACFSFPVAERLSWRSAGRDQRPSQQPVSSLACNKRQHRLARTSPDPVAAFIRAHEARRAWRNGISPISTGSEPAVGVWSIRRSQGMTVRTTSAGGARVSDLPVEVLDVTRKSASIRES